VDETIFPLSTLTGAPKIGRAITQEGFMQITKPTRKSNEHAELYASETRTITTPLQYQTSKFAGEDYSSSDPVNISPASVKYFTAADFHSGSLLDAAAAFITNTVPGGHVFATMFGTPADMVRAAMANLSQNGWTGSSLAIRHKSPRLKTLSAVATASMRSSPRPMTMAPGGPPEDLPV
jgi:hypothetical protein